MAIDETLIDNPQRAVNLGVGFASPLWPTFFVAASAGVAYWAWSQWARGEARHEFATAFPLEQLTSPTVTPADPPAVFDPPVETPEPEYEASPETYVWVEPTPEEPPSEAASAVEPEAEPPEVVAPEATPEVQAFEADEPEPAPASPRRPRKKG